MGALKDVYQIVFDLPIKANLPTEVAKLRGKLEQLEEEHGREVQQLKQQIKEPGSNGPKGVAAIIQQEDNTSGS